MARVTQHTAAKDAPKACPQAKKGEVYYGWKTRMKGQRDGVFRCTVGRPPKASELTSSEYLSRVYEIQEEIAEATAESIDDFESMRDGWVEAIRELGDEQGEKFDNMPDGLQQGDTGQLLEERRDECEAWADELEAVTVNERDEDTYDPDDHEAYENDVAQDIAEAISECAGTGPG